MQIFQYQLHLESLKNLPKWEASHRDWEDKRRGILDEQREKMDRLWKEYGKARSNPPKTKFQKDFSITGSGTHWINQYKACSDLILTGRGLQKDFSKRCSSIYHHRSTTEEVALAPNGVGAIGPPKGDAKAHDGSEAKHCDGGEAEHCDGL
nr:hypothetical protein Iba_chr04dCG15140 [Ipomoea batatas]